MRACALVVLLCAVAVARADEVSTTARARAYEHFTNAEKLYRDGADFDAAVVEYLAAYRLQPHPNVLFNIALAYERIYKPDEARTYFERFLNETDTGPGPSDNAKQLADFRSKAEARLKVLRALPGSILVDANKPNASVRLAGEGLKREARTPIRFEDLPPGDYRLHVELAYHAPIDTTFHLEPGGHGVVSVHLEHQLGDLTVYTRPDRARVFLDGHDEGRTTFSRAVETGRHRRLRIEVDDFPPHEELVDILPNKPIRREIVFRRPFRTGRTELILGAMTYGGFVGVSLGFAAGVGKQLPQLLLAGIGGVGVGFFLAFSTTTDRVKVGHSSTIIGATSWGTISGAALAYALRLTDPCVPDQPCYAWTPWALTLAGGTLGFSLGLLSSRLADPTPGDAAIVNSGGTWGSLVGVLVSESIGFPLRCNTSGLCVNHDQALGFFTLGGVTLGVVTGALIARFVEVSRGHVAIVDVGGLAGLALGFGIGYGVSNTTTDGARYGLGGLVLGLAAAAILSRNFKDDLPPTKSLVNYDQGRWRLGVPGVSVTFGNTVTGTADARVNVVLAKGEF